MPDEAQDRLIVALDVSSLDQAKAFVERLDGLVAFFKVGIELQLAEGMPPVRYLTSAGKRVFLDLKYFDVPQTVGRAVHQAASLGVDFLTIHGNARNMEAAVRGRGNADLKLLAVTVLTSLDADDIRELGFECPVEELVLYRARKALEAGCDGVIASLPESVSNSCRAICSSSGPATSSQPIAVCSKPSDVRSTSPPLPGSRCR